MNVRKRTIAAIVVNIAVIVMEIAGFILSYQANGPTLIRFYTEDSNLLTAVACIICAASLIRSLKSGEPVSRGVHLLKYIAMSCLAVTFFVVIFVLAPMMESVGYAGYKIMLFHGSMLYMHLLCPVVAIGGFIWLENEPYLEKKCIRYALIPTLIYAAVTTTLNIVRLLDGPYPFLRVHNQAWYMSVIWIAVIIGLAALLAWIIWRILDKKAGAH